ncbi:MAG: hypothetical protein KF696_03040 [Planctomycetes bacterium]|nr:hypothetical protein [Planctomycetota bacterium]MCW8134981.1 hypothetical protein [Planctomycetota bacterium]
MNLKLTLSATAMMAVMLASGVMAQSAKNILPQYTTVQRLTEASNIVVVARLDRTENVQLAEQGIDAKRWPSRDDGKVQDGQNNIRRDGVLKVEQVLKGNVPAGSDIRFVSVRQLRYENYESRLQGTSAIWFLAPRPEDARLTVLADTRGAITAEFADGKLSTAVDFVRDQVAGANTLDRMLDAIDFKGGRVSQDCCYELSWHHETWREAVTHEHGQRIISMAQASPVGSVERNELITAIGRYKPEGSLDALMGLVLSDASWSTTSLGCWSLEEVNRGAAIQRLLSEWANAGSDKSRQIAIVRALGLIRPKSGHDGEQARTDTLNLVGGLLKATTDKDLLREALIASRDLRTEQEHVEALKKLIDERDSNGLGDAEVKAAIIALAAARKTIHTQTGIAEAVYARKYLEDLAAVAPLLAQVIKPALEFPWTMLIVGADGRGH